MSLAAQLQYVGYSLLGLVLLGGVLIVVARIRRGPEEPAPEEVPHEGVGLDDGTLQFLADLARDADDSSDAWWDATLHELRGKADSDWRYRLHRDVDRLLDAAWTARLREAEQEIADMTAEFTHLVACGLEETSEIPMGVPA